MGLEWSQEKLFDLGVLWRALPPNIKIEITREKVTVIKKPDPPKLDISTRVINENYNNEEEHDLWANLVKQLSDDDTGSVKKCFNFTDRMPSMDSNSSVEVIPQLQKPDISGVHSAEMEIEMSTPEVKIISPPIFKQSSSSSDLIGEILERKVATLFDTFVDIVTDSDGGVSPVLQQQSAKKIKPDGKTDVHITPKEVQRLSPVNTANGGFLPKKIAKVYEQKGKLECHVYFTPRTSAQIWPHLTLTVHEDWDFLKIMRKSIAEIQRAIKKGDRDGTHDWVFGYHPNKQVEKIKKELRVLFGGRATEFRGSNLKKKIKPTTKNFVNKMWVLQKKSFGKQDRDRGRSVLNQIGSFRAKSMPHLIKKQEDNPKKLKVSTDENFGKRDSPISSTSVNLEVMHERKPTKLFETFLDTETDSGLAVEASLQQHDGALDGKTDIKIIPQKVHCISPHRTANSVVLPKKIAKVYQRKGKLECHVYFTPRTSAEVWPHLVVTVLEDWDFLKVMRKSVAEIQRAIKKGDRDGTHDWVFAYDPNKQVAKIKKELRVLFGELAIEFKDYSLKKKLKTKTEGFVNKIWVLPKKSIGKEDKGRRLTVSRHVGAHRAKSQPPLKKKLKGMSKVTSKRQSRKERNKMNEDYRTSII